MKHICPVCHGRSIARLAGGGITDCATCFGTGRISDRDRVRFFAGIVAEAMVGLVVIWALLVISSGVPR